MGRLSAITKAGTDSHLNRGRDKENVQNWLALKADPAFILARWMCDAREAKK